MSYRQVVETLGNMSIETMMFTYIFIETYAQHREDSPYPLFRSFNLDNWYDLYWRSMFAISEREGKFRGVTPVSKETFAQLWSNSDQVINYLNEMKTVCREVF